MLLALFAASGAGDPAAAARLTNDFAARIPPDVARLFRDP